MLQALNSSCVDSSSDEAAKPGDRAYAVHLWVDSLEYLGDAPKHFNIKLPGSDPEPGDHIIALREERDIRRVIRKLQVLSANIKILPPEQLLSDVISIAIKGTPLDIWCQLRKDSPLELEEGLEIAADILQSFSNSKVNSTQKNLELEALRRRCDVNSFDWNRYIADLEKDIHAAVDGKGKTDPASREERLNLEIKALTKEHDSIKRLFAVNDIASRYSLSKSDVYLLIREIGRSTQTPKCESFTFDELLDQESEGISYLIPGMLPKGETVLCAGMPKAGKTLLAVDAAFAIATGESDFLGEKVKQGKVLLVSVDESAQSTKAKLLKRGFRRGDQLEVMTKWDISQLNDLESKLEVLRPELVIIDSLKRITLGREISENSAEFADMVYQLKELTGKYGVACILIHHTNKNGDAVGLERVRGSTAIAGAVWGTWMLDRIPKPDPDNKKRMKIDPSDPTRILSVIPRDCSGQELKLELNSDNLSFSISTETEEDQQTQQEKQTQQQRILDLLTKYAPKGLTGREIIERLDLSRSAYNTLSLMVERRLITQRQSNTDHRSMVYCSILPPPPPSDEKNMTNLSTTTVVESKTNSHELVMVNKKISHTPLTKNEAHDKQNQEPVNNVGDSHVLTPGEGGGGAEPIESPVSNHASSTDDDEANQVTGILPIGWWVRIPSEGNKLAQVTAHTPAGAYIKGEKYICGTYPDAIPLTKEDMLKKGLSWTS